MVLELQPLVPVLQQPAELLLAVARLVLRLPPRPQQRLLRLTQLRPAPPKLRLRLFVLPRLALQPVLLDLELGALVGQPADLLVELATQSLHGRDLPALLVVLRGGRLEVPRSAISRPATTP